MRSRLRHATSIALVALAAHALSAHTLGAQGARGRPMPKDISHVAPAPKTEPQRFDEGSHATGAALHAYHGYGGYGYGSAFTNDVWLQALLYPPGQLRMRFALNYDAYVAVFEIQPGRGVRVVFPDDWAGERQLAAGYYEPPLPINGDALAAKAGPANAGGVRYLYLVASDTPLGLSPGRRSVDALEALIGPAAFRSQSNWEVTDALRRRVLSLGGPGSWTEQVVAFRPGIDDMVSVGGLPGVATVRCGNGVEYAVRAGERFSCPR